MKIAIEGIMPMSHSTVKDIIESNESLGLVQINEPRMPRTTLVFEGAGTDSASAVPAVKAAIRATDWGKGHVFNVRALS